MNPQEPRIVVLSSLYPSQVRPSAGVFVRERMSRVATHLPLTVVSPVPWFPLQFLIRWWKPDYRPQPAYLEQQNGIQVYFPKFLAIPGFFREFDGFFMALSCLPLLLKLKKQQAFNVIDAHFAYPDGYAASLLGQWLNTPVTITLRGTEVPLSKIPARQKRLLKALAAAKKVFSVSESLKQHVVDLGADAHKIEVVGNGVDATVFFPVDKHSARQPYGLHVDDKVLISVGGLVPRKGFHRVIEILPQLLEKHPKLVYLIVGGASPEGDMRYELEQQVQTLGLTAHVRFLGALPTAELKQPLSCADVFVLATANEGWANVFLEAMACGLPVVTTDVGGNREVVVNSELGAIVPFGEPQALLNALNDALNKNWNRQAIISYAQANAWDERVARLVAEFERLAKLL